MIYENYNRPEFIRKIDEYKYKFFHEAGKFGIMQLERKNPITDEESIEIARKKLERIYTIHCKNKTNYREIIKILIKKYYKEDMKEIETIYQVIKNFIQK